MTRNTVSRGLFAVLALGIALPVAAAPKAAAKAEKDPNIYCPIMDMDFKKSEGHKAMHNGKAYWVCCKKCKKIFEKDPKKQAASYTAKTAEHNKKKKS